MKKPTSNATRADASGTVHFALPYLPAHEVFLAGSFNGWQPAALRLEDARGDAWTADVPLPPGVHEYRFVVDGRWIADPNNPRTVPNPFGGRNSVVEVDPPARPRSNRKSASKP